MPPTLSKRVGETTIARSIFSANLGLALALLSASLLASVYGLALTVPHPGDTLTWAWFRNLWPMAAVAVPGALAAIAVAESQHWKSIAFWVPAGGAIAVLGYLTMLGPDGSEHSFVAAWASFLGFLVAGLAGGLVYWLVRGRRTGNMADAVARASDGSISDTTGRRLCRSCLATMLLAAMPPLALIGWHSVYNRSPVLPETLLASAETDADRLLANAGIPWARMKITDGVGHVEGRAPDRTSGRFAFGKAKALLAPMTGVFGVISDLEDDVVSP